MGRPPGARLAVGPGPRLRLHRRSAPAPRPRWPLLDRALAAEGASPTGEAGPDGQRSYRLPPGTSPDDAAERVREAARAADIELYSAPSGDFDVELRVYAGPELAARVLLRPALGAASRLAPHAPTLRERPLLAVIITGLGDRPPGDLAALPIPLTLSIRPYEAFSLQIAEEGMLHWHEVLLELDRSEGAASPSEQLRALPHGSGLVLTGPVTALQPIEGLPMGVLVYPDGLSPPATTLARVRAHAPTGAPATEAVARALHLASRDGHASVLLAADDPSLGEALSGLLDADARGYRLVLATEVARPDQMHGPPSLAGEPLNP